MPPREMGACKHVVCGFTFGPKPFSVSTLTGNPGSILDDVGGVVLSQVTFGHSKEALRRVERSALRVLAIQTPSLCSTARKHSL